MGKNIKPQITQINPTKKICSNGASIEKILIFRFQLNKLKKQKYRDLKRIEEILKT